MTDPSPTRHVVVMGVSGCGKSTVAEGLAEHFDLPFAEADSFHPQANIEKMSNGIPLTDEDRYPWLGELAAWIGEREAEGSSSVMACSALRREYRDILRTGAPAVEFVHLHGPMEVIAERMAKRQHFMPPALLQSQFDTLEELEPDEAGVVLDLRKTAPELVDEAVAWVRSR